MAQNGLLGPTGEAHRGQVGPDPGAVSRRPHCGQKGCSWFVAVPQKGQAAGAPPCDATVGRGTTRVAGDGVVLPAAAVFTPADPLMGFPQSMQNCALASLSRPQ